MVYEIPCLVYKQGESGVFGGNALHRTMTHLLELVIFAFYIVTEEFRGLPIPDDEKCFVKLVELGGYIHAACLDFPRRTMLISG